MTASSEQEITSTSITQEGGETTLVFTRPLAPTNTSKIVLSSEEGEEAIFIWGAGSGNTLAEHVSRGDVTVADLYCTGSSSETEFAFEEELTSGLTLSWSVAEDNSTVSVKVKRGERQKAMLLPSANQINFFVGLPIISTLTPSTSDVNQIKSLSSLPKSRMSSMFRFCRQQTCVRQSSEVFENNSSYRRSSAMYLANRNHSCQSDDTDE